MKHTYWNCLKEINGKVFEDKHVCVCFIFAMLFLLIGIASHISIPLIFKNLVDNLPSNERPQVIFILAAYGCIWFVNQMSTDLRTLLIYKIDQRITYTLSIIVISHLYGLSQQYFIERKPGAITNIIRRAQQDIPTIILGFFFQVLPTLIEFLFVIGVIWMLYPPHFSLLLGFILVVYFLYIYFTMKYVFQERHVANEIDQKTDGIITDWLSNYETVKTFGLHNLALNHSGHALKNREKAEIKFMKIFSATRLGQSFILSAGLTLLTYCVGISVINGQLTIGDFVLFNGYILQFIIPLNILGQVTQDIKKSFVSMRGTMDILLTQSDIQSGKQTLLSSENDLSIEFRNVNFDYNGKKIFNNFSFKINPGETALITGASGIGKSTIAKLMLRLYDVKNGQILINGINLRDLTFTSLYETICWVPQETYLFNDTIKNNLQFVKPEANIHDIEVALKQVALFDFVQSLPNGLDTFVGEKGVKLSGGQKQRISLARLFLKKPKICIFDEPTSFLDQTTENIIQTHINKYLPKMTKIIITHRPFMINQADKIIKICKDGNFEMNVHKIKNPKNKNFDYVTARQNERVLIL